MPRKAASLKSGSSTNDRLEPRLLRAIEANDETRVTDIIQEARAISYGNPHFLSIGLVRACDKNLVDVAKLLLSQGADPNYVSGNKLPSLRRATESGFVELAEALLNHGADREASDKKGRTALMTAAYKNQFEIVKVLLKHGASVHTVDLRNRTVLHNVAADLGEDKGKAKAPQKGQPKEVEKKQLKLSPNEQPKPTEKARSRCSMEIVEYLIRKGAEVEAKDALGRTALHWACAANNEALLRTLLGPELNAGSLKAHINCVDGRMKTPLHLAVMHKCVALARILLERGVLIDAKSDGGWTALHNACQLERYGKPDKQETQEERERREKQEKQDKEDRLALVQLLLLFKADANAELINGRTPLHVAAESGNEGAAKCLLDLPRIRRAVKDRFGNTPLLIAAQNGKKNIVEMLAPWNHMSLLSEEEIQAAKQFDATIVDFGNFRNENKVTRLSVYDLLYARNPNDSTKPLVSTLTQNVKGGSFRWLHIPVNNIAWCDALLTKRFIEEDARDVEGYKAIEASFNHQHRGQQHHAKFMRPMCQTVRRAQEDEKPPETPVVVIHEADSSLLETPERINSSPEPWMSPLGIHSPEDREQLSGGAELRTPNASRGGGRMRSGDAMPRQGQARHPRRQPARRPSRDSLGPSPSRRGFHSLCNVYLFMPYLHFETDANRKAMVRAMEPPRLPRTATELTQDEVLMRAHMAASSSFLHIRRTLDQFFYHNIDTQQRDGDQVVYRFQKKHRKPPDLDPKIFMVDQLWMWILGRDTVITSFPQRWQQPRNDPLNVLEGIIEDINSKTREPVQSVFELAMTISGRCFGTFDRHRKGDDEFQFMDMFEASLGSAMDQEAKLFREFSIASRQASAYIKSTSGPSKFERALKAAAKAREAESPNLERPRFDETNLHEPSFVDKLLDVGAETDLLAEIKDIREELDIIRMVLSNQHHLLDELRESIRSIHNGEKWYAQLRRAERKFEEQVKTIVNPVKDIDRMDKQAERIYGSIRDLLDLKQKHANAFEARFARTQAAGTVRQGRTIMVFTIVTVIFLPLSFIAAVFAINIENFPHKSNGQQEMTLSFVSEYTFGIGLAISIPLILIALSVDELTYGFSQTRQWFRKHWRKVTSKDLEKEERRTQDRLIEQKLSQARSMRRSLELSDLSDLNWNKRMPGSNTQAVGYQDGLRKSWDVERGLQSRFP